MPQNPSMKSILGIAIATLFLIGPKGWFDSPPKAKCPFKDGIMKKLTEHKGIVIGPGESTVDIWGRIALSCPPRMAGSRT